MSILNIEIGTKTFNNIKFKKPFEQLRIVRHELSNYDAIINDYNWQTVTKDFVKEVSIKIPHLLPIATQWAKDKIAYNLTNHIR